MKKLFCLLLALLTIGGCALAETENKTDEAVLNIFMGRLHRLLDRHQAV
ncbi:MAG: hypothetical protein ACLS7Z_03045 [Christensenellales bacterium]